MLLRTRACGVLSTWNGWGPMLRGLVAIAVLAPSFIPGARAHSLDEVNELLKDDEKYADLRGKVVVLHFVYTSCPDVCPLHAEKLAEVQQMVNATPMKGQVIFVTVTTDPKRDTPDVLRAYGPAHGLDPANWLFLTTTQDQSDDATGKLAEAFGHKFTLTDDAYQMHGIVTHVIDKEGHWRANFHGLNFAPVNLVTMINALTNNLERPHTEPEKGWLARLRNLL
ncbi:MAG: SCO family protein [Mesorhizobium sp.]|nr:MAG: SCO family protein [Mesorhizobium sp.]